MPGLVRDGVLRLHLLAQQVHRRREQQHVDNQDTTFFSRSLVKSGDCEVQRTSSS